MPLLRDHSRKFNKNRYSEHSKVHDAICAVFSQIVDIRKGRREKVLQPIKWQEHLSAIVLDLYCAYKNPPWIYLAISRRPKDYTAREGRYSVVTLSYRYTVDLLDDLEALGYIDQARGFYERASGVGYLTRISAKHKLIEILEAFGVQHEMIECRSIETIRLRDKAKIYIDYKETDATRRMRENLTTINTAIGKRRIRLGLNDQEMNSLNLELARDPSEGAIDLNDTRLYRVFNNGSFGQGGRFYGGWWQRIPRAYRPYIYIDYKNTIEVDYSGLHIRMLYAKLGEECPDDPYDLDAFPREQQKEAMLTLINSSDRKKAVKSLKREKIGNVEQLCDVLIKRHQPIAEFFFTGKGVDLQFEDSKIAELVMLKIIQLGGIALPVHDSFIVRNGREDELETAMREAFQEVFPGVESRFKRKEDVLELRAKVHGRGSFSQSLKNVSDEDWQRMNRIHS